MPKTPSVLRRRLVALVVALLAASAVGAFTAGGPALAQDGGGDPSTSSTTSTSEGGITIPPVGGDTTTTTAPPDDPGGGEEVPAEPVPVVPETVPPREPEPGVYEQQAGRIIRQQLEVAQADAVELETTYRQVKDLVVGLESELDLLELGITGLADSERAAVRRVELARRKLEGRAARAIVRGGSNDLEHLIASGDPNDIAIAQTLLGSVLRADDDAVREYLEAKSDVSADLVRVAERLAAARLELEDGRARLVEARRASVSAQFNLAVFAAGSEIVIKGFVFPVGDPHTFGDSFGAPRMMGSQYEHAHQGTDIMAPFDTPLLAAERGVITEMGTGVLGGNKLWVKGESGTYYYYAHLRSFAPDLQNGDVVEAGTVVGLVGNSGNASGGAPHVHFEIHPDGGPAVNPYPLLKVIDDLRRQAKEREQQ